MVNSGLNELNGSCGTNVISRPRIAPDDRKRSRPAKLSEPPSTLAFGGNAPRMVRDSVVLPQPDSPTSPMISPAASDRFTPSSPRALPASVTNDTARSRTDSNSADIASHPRIEHVTQAVTQQVEPHHHQQDRHAGCRRVPPGLRQEAAAFRDHAPPLGC